MFRNVTSIRILIIQRKTMIYIYIYIYIYIKLISCNPIIEKTNARFPNHEFLK